MQDLVSIVLLKAQTIQTIPEDRKLLLEDMRVRGGELHQNLELLVPPMKGTIRILPPLVATRRDGEKKRLKNPPRPNKFLEL